MSTHRIKPGKAPKLHKVDTAGTPDWSKDREAGEARALELNKEFEALQELLYAEGKRRVLVVLQAMDTGGKDGVIRKVFEGVNPMGVRVASFKQPSSLELSHNYLWRYFQQLPKRGEIVIFNRSHYESVLVERVHELVPKKTWKRRYKHIADMEQAIADEGTTIIKFFLHISKAEQKLRLQARLDDKSKIWKFSAGDVAERKRWSHYMEAYEEAIEQTSSDDAPWYVIPADKKWYRDLAISQVIVDTLKELNMSYPKPASGLDSIVIPD
ncbi:MAG: polyphosphate kinase 2 family protein [Chloroflexi bacterium]|nr:polyphosphate kinase 2 family protein [Chloroflexota bacterium]